MVELTTPIYESYQRLRLRPHCAWILCPIPKAACMHVIWDCTGWSMPLCCVGHFDFLQPHSLVVLKACKIIWAVCQHLRSPEHVLTTFCYCLLYANASAEDDYSICKTASLAGLALKSTASLYLPSCLWLICQSQLDSVSNLCQTSILSSKGPTRPVCLFIFSLWLSCHFSAHVH